MKSVEELGRKLHELDARQRAGSLSRAEYRKVRRKAILAVEDPNSETVPNSVDPALDKTIEHASPTVPGAVAHAAARRTAPASAGSRRVLWIFIAIGALAALVAAAILLPRSQQSAPSSAPLAGIPDAGAPAVAGPDLPQTVADRLMKSEWSDADIAAFLAKWNGISPEARRAARDDAGMWLLRGETDRRLREAVDAAALDPTPQAQSRIDRLAALQGVIRPE